MTRDPLNCRELIDFIERYLEGDLPDEQRRVFEDHLAICPYCVDYLASYCTTIRLGRNAYPEDESEIPEDVPRQLVEAVLASRGRGS